MVLHDFMTRRQTVYENIFHSLFYDFISLNLIARRVFFYPLVIVWK